MRNSLKNIKLMLVISLLMSLAGCTTCKYGFKDAAPIPTEIKTFRVNYLENKAQYVNTQLSPQLTEQLKQKIRNTTRLSQTNSDEAHYDISGFVSQYYTTTVSINNNNSSGNRLSVGFHLVFKNSLDEKKNFEADLLRTFDFDSRLTLQDAERTLNESIVKNITDEIFNKIFSNW